MQFIPRREASRPKRIWLAGCIFYTLICAVLFLRFNYRAIPSAPGTRETPQPLEFEDFIQGEHKRDSAGHSAFSHPQVTIFTREEYT